jgi:hypothetical protein
LYNGRGSEAQREFLRNRREAQRMGADILHDVDEV